MHHMLSAAKHHMLSAAKHDISSPVVTCSNGECNRDCSKQKPKVMPCVCVLKHTHMLPTPARLLQSISHVAQFPSYLSHHPTRKWQGEGGGEMREWRGEGKGMGRRGGEESK